MSEILFEAALILALLVLNGLFAMSEIAVVTARRVRLTRRAEAGDAGAAAALELASEPTQFLSTVQIGITLVGILAGAFGGATIAEEMAPMVAGWPVVGPHSEVVSFIIVVASITYFSVILGELVPKRLALSHPERIASLVSRPMRLAARIGTPVVHLLTASTELVLKVFRLRPATEPAVTEDDIRALVAQGTASGTVAAEEEEILDRVLHLGDRTAGAVMTPRTELEWIDVRASTAEIRSAFLERGHSRILVCDDDIENIVGIVRARDLLVPCLEGGTLDLRQAARAPLFIPETMPLLTLVASFRQSESQTAIVLDEYGGVEGIVTLTDVLTDLVADIPGRPDPGQETIQRSGPDSWVVDGGVLIEDLATELDIDLPAMERRRGYRTVAGCVMTELGRVPDVGDRISKWGYSMEVVRMDGRRVDAVAIRRPDTTGARA